MFVASGAKQHKTRFTWTNESSDVLFSTKEVSPWNLWYQPVLANVPWRNFLSSLNNLGVLV